MAEFDGVLRPELAAKPRKRKIVGSKRDLAKKERLSSHVVGDSCKCVRLQCFEKTTGEEREQLVSRFNALSTKNEQDTLLASLIAVSAVKQRRPRKDEDRALLHEHSYSYQVRVVRDGKSECVPVCIKALTSIFGITKGRLETVKASIF